MQQNGYFGAETKCVNHNNWNKYYYFFQKSRSSRLIILNLAEWASLSRFHRMNMYNQCSVSTLPRQCFPFITGLLPCVLVSTEAKPFDSKISICKFVTFSGFIDCCASKNPAPNIHLKAHSSIITFGKIHLISSNIPYVGNVWRLLRAHSHRGGWCLELCCFRFASCACVSVCTHKLPWKWECGWTEWGKRSERISKYWVSFSICDVHPCVHLHGWDKLLFI